MTTVTLLTLKSDFFRLQGEHFSSTASGGSTAKLTDSALVGYVSETYPTKIVGQQLRVTSGSASGDLRLVARFDPSEGDVYPNRAPSAAIANANTYELWGTSINGGQPLTDLFNDVIRDLRPTTDTQITIVTNQRMYDATTLVQSRRDIKAVYLRLLDAAAVEPHRIAEINWTAYDRGGAGTTSVMLDITPLTRDDNNLQLWLRGATGFTAFSADTSTVDAVYRDWLAWEAVYELAQRKISGGSDAARWRNLQARALREVSSWRGRWLPVEPIPITVW